MVRKSLLGYVRVERIKSIGICPCGAYKVYWDMYVWCV